MRRPEIQNLMLWRLLVCTLGVLACLGFGGCDGKREVRELHFELAPSVASGVELSGFGVDRFAEEGAGWVPEYFADKELHNQLSEGLGRSADDIGKSLSVEAVEDKFILRAEGKDLDEADALIMRAFTNFQNSLVASQQRVRDETVANMERQIELQKIKVAEAKARMDAAYEKLQESESEEGFESDVSAQLE